MNPPVILDINTATAEAESFRKGIFAEKFAGMDNRDFALAYEQETNDPRYRQLLGNTAERFASRVGEVSQGIADYRYFDSKYSAGELLGGGFKNTVDFFGADESLSDASFEAGRGVAGSLPGMLAMVANPLVGLSALYSQNYNQNILDGRTKGQAHGGAALAAAMMGIARPLGTLIGGTVLKTGAHTEGLFGAVVNRATAKASEAGMLKAAAALQGKAVQVVGRELAVEVTQTAAGVFTDMIDVIMFDPNRTLADLAKKEVLIPMIMGDAFMYAGGNGVIFRGPAALKTKLNTAYPDSRILNVLDSGVSSLWKGFDFTKVEQSKVESPSGVPELKPVEGETHEQAVDHIKEVINAKPNVSYKEYEGGIATYDSRTGMFLSNLKSDTAVVPDWLTQDGYFATFKKPRVEVNVKDQELSLGQGDTFNNKKVSFEEIARGPNIELVEKDGVLAIYEKDTGLWVDHYVPDGVKTPKWLRESSYRDTDSQTLPKDNDGQPVLFEEGRQRYQTDDDMEAAYQKALEEQKAYEDDFEKSKEANPVMSQESFNEQFVLLSQATGEDMAIAQRVGQRVIINYEKKGLTKSEAMVRVLKELEGSVKMKFQHQQIGNQYLSMEIVGSADKKVWRGARQGNVEEIPAGVYDYDNSNPKAVQVINELLTGLGINDKLRIFVGRIPGEFDNKTNFGNDKPFGNQGVRADGFVHTPDSQSNAVQFVSNRVDTFGKGKFANEPGWNTIMHETGHIVQRYMELHKPKVWTQIVNEYNARGKKNSSSNNIFDTYAEFYSPVQSADLKLQGHENRDFKSNNERKQVESHATQMGEWIAENFVKWGTTNKKPKSTIEKFFYEVSTMLKTIYEKFQVAFKGKPVMEDIDSFQRFLKKQGKDYFNRLVKAQDPVLLAKLREKHHLTDRQSEVVAGHLYKNEDATYREHVFELLQKWSDAKADGRRPDLGRMLTTASKHVVNGRTAVDSNKPISREEALNRNFTALEAIRLHSDSSISSTYDKISKTIQDTITEQSRLVGAKSDVDYNEVILKADEAVIAWLDGDGGGQAGVPQAGGINKLAQMITSRMHSRARPPERLTFKADGSFDKHSKTKFYDTAEAAYKAEQALSLRADLQGYVYSVDTQNLKSDKTTWFIEAIKKDDITTGDELMFERSSDKKFFQSKSEFSMEEFKTQLYKRFNVVPAEVELVESHVNTVRKAEDFNGGVKSLLYDMFQGNWVAQKMFDTMAKNNELFLDDPLAAGMLKGFGQDYKLGKITDPNVYLEQLAFDVIKGRIDKNDLNLLPEPLLDNLNLILAEVSHIGDIANAMKAGETMAGGGRTIYQAPNMDLLGDKAGSARHAETTQTDQMLQATEAGGIGEQINAGTMSGRLIRAGLGKVEKLWDSTVGGAIHMAMANPLVRQIGEAMHAETGLQESHYTNIMSIYHHKDIAAGDLSQDKDRSFVKVRGSVKTQKGYDDLVRLEQKYGRQLKDFDKEILAQLEAQEILNRFTEDEQSAILDLRQRSYDVQIRSVEIRHETNQMVDSKNIAAYMVRNIGLKAGEADEIATAIYAQSEVEAAARMMTQGGIKPNDLAKVWDLTEQLREVTNEENSFLMEHPEWVSESRNGRYMVSFVSKGSKTTGMESFDTLPEAEAFKVKIRGEGAIVDKVFDARLRNTNFKKNKDLFSVLEEALDKKKKVLASVFADDEQMLRSLNNLIDGVQTDVQGSLRASNKLNVTKNRQFKEGRESLNMLDQQQSYVRRLTLAGSRARTDSVFRLYETQPELQNENGQRILGLLKQGQENMRTPDSKVGRALNKFGFTMFLGMNISSALIESMSSPMVVAPSLVEIGAGHMESYRVLKESMGQTFTAMTTEKLQGKKNSKSAWADVDPEFGALVTRAENEGRLNVRKHSDLEENHVMDDVDAMAIAHGEEPKMRWRVNPAQVAYKTARGIYAPFNRFNAEVSLVSAFKIVSKYNPELSFEQRYTKALLTADTANGSAGRANRPMMLLSGKGSMNAVGSAMFMLQSFTASQIANQMRWMKKSFDKTEFSPEERKGARKAWAQAAAFNMVGLGVASGLPMGGVLAALFKKLFGEDLEELMKEAIVGEDTDDMSKQFIAQMATKGLPHALGLPSDFASRLRPGGVVGFNDYDGWSAEGLLGPAFSYAKGAAGVVDEVKAGKGARAYVELLPVGLRRMVRMEFFDDGKIRDRRGSLLLDPTEAEKFGAVLGFNPTRAVAEKSRQNVHRDLNERKAQVKQQGIQEASRQFEDGNIARARLVLDQIAQQYDGIGQQDMMNGFVDAQTTRQFGQQERGSSFGLASMQANALNPSSVPRVGAAERLVGKQRIRQQIGVTTPLTNNAMRNAQAIDMMISRNPLLSPSQAKQILDQNRGRQVTHSRGSALSEMLR